MALAGTKFIGNSEEHSIGIHVVAKPTGPSCNLNCDYCFYLEKQALFGSGENTRMSDNALRVFIANYIESQPTPVVEFVWQGGEPTLLGVDFFRRVVELQRPYAQRKTIANSLQTNGTLLTEEWCRFLKAANFMVGISIDGPQEIHDRYRRDRGGKGSFGRALRGLRLLQKHGVAHNVMACVARETARHPLDVYGFFKTEGVEFIQFTPIIEREPDAASLESGLCLAAPASLDKKEVNIEVTPWTVDPEEYGNFLIAIYEDWVRHDVGNTFIMNFEWALSAWLGEPSSVCVHAEQCGRSLAVEHNGDVYACDHFVYPRYRIGSIFEDSCINMADRSQESGFGIAKQSKLPYACERCEVMKACGGGCPKHRFGQTLTGDPGLHYLCAGYKKFFLHIRKYLRGMTQLLANDLPLSYIMQAAHAPLAIMVNKEQ